MATFYKTPQRLDLNSAFQGISLLRFGHEHLIIGVPPNETIKIQKVTTQSHALCLNGHFNGLQLARDPKDNRLIIDTLALQEDGVQVEIVDKKSRAVLINRPETPSAQINGRSYDIGSVLPDGWILGPLSPTTGRHLKIEPPDENINGDITWDEGEFRAHKIEKGARHPTLAELKAIYKHIVRGGQDENTMLATGIFTSRQYWTSTPYNNAHPGIAMTLHVDHGATYCHLKHNKSATSRLVRDGYEPLLLEHHIPD
ncbi:MAG: hypothetical protein ACLFRA_02340 [Alphaproteobacteria bacterium]